MDRKRGSPRSEPVTDSNPADGLAEERTELADRRTDYAEDRTVLANERTFAGWIRTGLAAVGIGVGFHALFGMLQPWWLPRASATLFILIGVFIFWSAEHRACAVRHRLDAHKVKQIPRRYVRIIAVTLSAGALVLIAGVWLLVSPSG